MWSTLAKHSFVRVELSGCPFTLSEIYKCIHELFDASPPHLAHFLKSQPTKSHYEIPWGVAVKEGILPAPIAGVVKVFHARCFEVLAHIASVSPSTETAWGTLDASVLRMWKYSEGGECREHADPGIVTALLGGSRGGLEVWDVGGEGSWRAVGDDGTTTALVLLGETAFSMTGGALPCARHRVVGGGGGDGKEARVNIILEFRPSASMWAHRMGKEEVSQLCC